MMKIATFKLSKNCNALEKANRIPCKKVTNLIHKAQKKEQASRTQQVDGCKIERIGKVSIYPNTQVNVHSNKRINCYLGSQPSISAIPTNDRRLGAPTFDA
jgi:hypothetical protein